MKNLIWLCLLSLCVVPTAGQHRGSVGHGGAGSGFGRGGFGWGFGSRSFGHQRFRSTIVAGRFNRRFGFNRFSPFGGFFDPYDYPLFAGGYDYGYQSSPSIVIVQQPTPQMIVQQAPHEVVQTVIHDYKEVAPASPPTTEAEESTFVIALSDGTRLAASAVWVQSSTVHYIDMDDLHHEVPLIAVDRQSTRKLNQERNLVLRLPAPSNQQ